MSFYLSIAVRLVLAALLGGIIGFERENLKRPAGFRTHILVCVGSALAMITSEFIFRSYSGSVNIDPARLGAQVISGIGFLGAGTIIRDGVNVRGLTTAASLWAVACVGIAAGIGFYEGAAAAAMIIYITLILLKRMEIRFLMRGICRTVYVNSKNVEGQLTELNSVFERHGVNVKAIELTRQHDGSGFSAKFKVRMKKSKVSEVISELESIDGVTAVWGR